MKGPKPQDRPCGNGGCQGRDRRGACSCCAACWRCARCGRCIYGGPFVLARAEPEGVL